MNGNTLFKFPFRVVALLVLPWAVGCGGSEKRTVSGTVSADGLPIEKGFVSFQPEEGKGETAGDQISNGLYKVSVEPGKYRVKVTIHQATAETEGDAREERKRRTKAMQRDLKSPERPPPPRFNGNDEVHEITADTRTLDINLQTPARRR
jgi:hypothetical protein